MEQEFRTGVIRPIECAKQGFELIKPDFWLLFAITLVGGLIAGATLYVLLGAMICGIFGCYLKRIDGGKIVFDDLWNGFKFFWPSLPVALAIVIPLAGFILLTFVSIYLPLITAAVMGTKADGRAIIGSLVLGLAIDLAVGIVMTCVHSLLIFSFPLIVDRGLSSWPAIKLSARAVLKNLGGVGGLICVNFGLAFLGYLALGVGLYFVIPIITAANLVAYRQVFPKQTSTSFEPAPMAYQGIS